MGYKIYVDHSRFSNGAKKIEEYIGTINSYMTSMDDEVNNMVASSWVGDDASAFKGKWNESKNPASATSYMKMNLQQYADNLNTAANKYKNAQISAINEANSLPKW